MPTKRKLLRSRVEEYVELLRREKRSERTLHAYRYELNRAFDALEAAGQEISPKKIKEKEINFLRDEFYKQGDMYNRYRLSIVGSFLKWCGNNIVERMRIGWPNDMRINANWLEPEDAMEIRRRAQGIEKIIVHLELDLCMRRIELLRLKVEDFHGDRIRVLGKGRMGGKVRTIPYHPETRQVLSAWLSERKRMVEKARKTNPEFVDTGALLIHERRGIVGAYHKSGIDKILTGLKKKVEVSNGRSYDFSNHTLRRTGGRMLWKAEVRLEVISTILGHEDTATTIDYLGLKLDDMSEGMAKLGQYQKSLIVPRNGLFASEPVSVSGPKEI